MPRWVRQLTLPALAVGAAIRCLVPGGAPAAPPTARGPTARLALLTGAGVEVRWADPAPGARLHAARLRRDDGRLVLEGVHAVFPRGPALGSLEVLAARAVWRPDGLRFLDAALADSEAHLGPAREVVWSRADRLELTGGTILPLGR